MSEKNIIQEYCFLKEEMNQKIQLHNTLLTFTITTSVAIITFALSENNPMLYLAPLLIIIPMSMRIAYYKLSIVKIAAYIIVFIEKRICDLKWETRNNILFSDKKTEIIDRVTFLKDYECLILSLTSYVLYIINYVKSGELDVFVIFNIAWPLIFILYEFLITIRMRLVDKKKNEWIKQWSAIKDKKVF